MFTTAKTEETYQVAVRLTKSEFERVEQMIEAGMFRSAADFAREAIRDKLREAEPIAIRDASTKDIERLVDNYLTKHPGQHFTSEIAESLGLDFRSTLETVSKMIEEGKIHKARAETT